MFKTYVALKDILFYLFNARGYQMIGYKEYCLDFDIGGNGFGNGNSYDYGFFHNGDGYGYDNTVEGYGYGNHPRIRNEFSTCDCDA